MTLLVIDNGLIRESLSTVPIRTVVDVTASRAIDGTVYTNTTGKTLFINITIRCMLANAGDTAYAITGTAGGNQMTGGFLAGPAGLQAYFELSISVPPDSTYLCGATVLGAGTTCTKIKWIESY